MAGDEWQEMPSFHCNRQQFSACTFNDKWFFIFGGLKLKGSSNRILPGSEGIQASMNIQNFDFVSEVEFFDVAKNEWKFMSYLQEPEKLRLINCSSTQINSKKIMIFGGIKSAEGST